MQFAGVTLPASEDVELTGKVVIIGHRGAGKTALVRRLVHNLFTENYKATLGYEQAQTVQFIDCFVVKLLLWDLAGQDNNVHQSRGLFRASAAAVVVYDVTQPESVERALAWLDSYRADMLSMYGASDSNAMFARPVVFLVGSKCDLLGSGSHVAATAPAPRKQPAAAQAGDASSTPDSASRPAGAGAGAGAVGGAAAATATPPMPITGSRAAAHEPQTQIAASAPLSPERFRRSAAAASAADAGAAAAAGEAASAGGDLDGAATSIVYASAMAGDVIAAAPPALQPPLPLAAAGASASSSSLATTTSASRTPSVGAAGVAEASADAAAAETAKATRLLEQLCAQVRADGGMLVSAKTGHNTQALVDQLARVLVPRLAEQASREPHVLEAAARVAAAVPLPPGRSTSTPAGSRAVSLASGEQLQAGSPSPESSRPSSGVAARTPGGAAQAPPPPAAAAASDGLIRLDAPPPASSQGGAGASKRGKCDC